MANDLAAMKARIADELGQRDDIPNQIALAITDAIKLYQPKRFLWNETRDITFNTVADQALYGQADDPHIPMLRSFDYLLLYIGNVLQGEITREDPKVLELEQSSGTSTGQPTRFAYYDRKIRLGPVPAAVYTVRVAGRIIYAAPAADKEQNNPWMVEAEALIRKRAKYELALNVIDDLELAQRLAPQITELEDALTGEASRLAGTGTVESMQF